MRLVEIRLLDGPNIYRLEPTVRIEVTVGRRRSWFGKRLPGRHSVVRLGTKVTASESPSRVVALTQWVRRLHRSALGRPVSVAIHRTSEPGHWVVSFPWREREKAETLARAAMRLAEGSRERLFERAVRAIDRADATPPDWITDEARRIRLISVSGTNGKSTTTRMLSHIAREAGTVVGTTTTDEVTVDGETVERGDYTGPLGAWAVMRHPGAELGVLETARGGILLRGLGYESNEASILTNVSADHLDLQGVHTLPELAEVKSVICRVTRPDGTVVLNADDRLVAAVARRVRARVVYFSLHPRSALVRAHVARGGGAVVLDEGWLIEIKGGRRRRLVPAAEVPATIGGLARHNVANALAAAAGARALGYSTDAVALGLRTFRNTYELMPGRLNLYQLPDRRLVIVDYAHNEAGLAVLLDTAEALVGRRGRRRATISVIVGAAGDRPDDSLHAMGHLAASRADDVAIKETLVYLRSRSRASLIGEIRAGMTDGGAPAARIAIYDDEISAIRAELTTPGRLAAQADGTPRVVILLCHAQRDEIARLLPEMGARPVDDAADLEAFRA